MTRAINPARQLTAILGVLPAARGRIYRCELHCVLPIRPSPASQTYTVQLRYRHGDHPHVTVIDPPLEAGPGRQDLPHVYPGNELCLYYPGEWRHNMLLATTVLPWIAEWLIHYEVWRVTGQWTGGGHDEHQAPSPRPPTQLCRTA